MKVVVRDHQQFHADARREHQALLREHGRLVGEVEQANREIEQMNERRRKEYEREKHVVEQWTMPRGLRGLLSSDRDKVQPKAPPEPEPLPLLELPPEPEPLHDEPTSYTAERLPFDYESDDGEAFKMIGPIRVLPGEWILTNDDTGQIHSVTNDDFERMFVGV
jgi:hypothetical protein